MIVPVVNLRQNDGAADRKPELVEHKWLAGDTGSVIEEIVRVEILVAQEPDLVTMLMIPPPLLPNSAE